MTDLEICKRITEIEGHKIKELPSGVKSTGIVVANPYPQSEDDCFTWYNPLTDKALCFDLMIKYNVVFLDGEASVTVLHSCNGYAEHHDPQKAICLAIIDSYKECKS